MKLSRLSMAVLIPLLGLAATLSSLLTACSDSTCTNGIVRMNISIPRGLGAGAVDVAFQIDGQVVHNQRLPVARDALSVAADIGLPKGYPAKTKVVVTVVAKRLEAGVEVPVATWSAAEVFPPGCIGFVISLFPTNTDAGGMSDGAATSPDTGVGDGVDVATPADGGIDAAMQSDPDGAVNEAGHLSDANIDAPAS